MPEGYNVGYHVAFTGTQQGMTEEQMESVRGFLERLLRKKKRVVLHHGDCIGADMQAHIIARDLNLYIEIHPPENPQKRANCHLLGGARVVHAEKEYLARNRDMVDASRMVLATPAGFKEVKRSGTWATVRYATSGIVRGISHAIIVWPDGESEDWQA